MEDFTNIQKIIEGCLLGDGHMEKGNGSKTPAFSYCSSSKQHVEFVHSFLKEYCTDNYQEIKRNEVYDKRTNKTYVIYFFRTKHLDIFNSIYDRFYISKVKVVPKDLVINKDVLLFWYIGDGELESNSGYIKLHTNSFTNSEVLFLCNKLNDFNAKILTKEKMKGQYLVTIPRNNVKNFLNVIGECPFLDYAHKWNFVEYKNKNIEQNGINYYTEIYPEIEKDFKLGNNTIYSLSKKYNVPITAIKNYFNSKKIKWETIITKKEINQFDLDGKFIKEWESGQEIKRMLNFNASGISKCCRGIRERYKGFIWKFK